MTLLAMAAELVKPDNAHHNIIHQSNMDTARRSSRLLPSRTGTLERQPTLDSDAGWSEGTEAHASRMPTLDLSGLSRVPTMKSVDWDAIQAQPSFNGGFEQNPAKVSLSPRIKSLQKQRLVGKQQQQQQQLKQSQHEHSFASNGASPQSPPQQIPGLIPNTMTTSPTTKEFVAIAQRRISKSKPAQQQQDPLPQNQFQPEVQQMVQQYAFALQQQLLFQQNINQQKSVQQQQNIHQHQFQQQGQEQTMSAHTTYRPRSHNNQPPRSSFPRRRARIT
jgi:hypothetical protein